MTVTANVGSDVVSPGAQISISSLFSFGANSAQTIRLQMDDDNEYTLSNSGTLGTFTGNGQSLGYEYPNSKNTDEYIPFTYQASTGRYYNSYYGYLDQMTYTASNGIDHAATLSIYSNVNGNWVDSSDVVTVTESSFTNPFPGYRSGQATPAEIAAIAKTYVGKVWNSEGCVLLAEDIAALAGSSLPATATESLPTPQNPIAALPNGEWIVAYDGTKQANPTIASAEAGVRTGDVVVITWKDGTTGHITTVVSGSGSQAQVIDNWSFGNNSAKDGSANDLIIAAAHSLDGDLTGNYANGAPDPAIPADIQIYRLDTPTIAINTASSTVAQAQAVLLAPMFTATDAGGAGTRTITEYSIYDSAGGTFSVGGASETAHSAATAILVSAAQLSTLSLSNTGPQGSTDTVTISAYNGLYWGDMASFSLTLSGTYTAASAVSALANSPSTSPVSISDSAAGISASLDGLQTLAAANKIGSLTLTDSGFAALSVTPSQLTTDATALTDISGSYYVVENASAANLTFTGMAGHGNEVAFNGNASQYSITAPGNGQTVIVTDTSTGRTSTDTLTNITALKFGDFTDIVAQTPGTGTVVTAGNITELYAAVFGRLPDIPGLAYYEAELQTNPSLSLTTLAQGFLASSEYVSNPAHNYAQTTAGDTQFIDDSYTNLLHRAPEAGAVPYYLGLISTLTQGLTPGTTAYSSAEAFAHAVLITDFSASQEFLSDVQVTAQTPSSAQHWLVLI